MCECRLDNVVYRLGLAPSRSAARQLVTHKHIVVNGDLINIPSFQVNENDIIGVREKSKSLLVIKDSLDNNKSQYEWLSWNSEKKEGILVSIPERSQIPENINEQFIVELYSK
jgi:small subunit ribosomal protein S4